MDLGFTTMETINNLNQKLVDGMISDIEWEQLKEFYIARHDRLADEYIRSIKIGNFKLKEKIDKKLDSAMNDLFLFFKTTEEYLIFIKEQCSNVQQTA